MNKPINEFEKYIKKLGFSKTEGDYGDDHSGYYEKEYAEEIGDIRVTARVLVNPISENITVEPPMTLSDDEFLELSLEEGQRKKSFDTSLLCANITQNMYSDVRTIIKFLM